MHRNTRALAALGIFITVPMAASGIATLTAWAQTGFDWPSSASTTVTPRSDGRSPAAIRYEYEWQRCADNGYMNDPSRGIGMNQYVPDCTVAFQRHQWSGVDAPSLDDPSTVDGGGRYTWDGE